MANSDTGAFNDTNWQQLPVRVPPGQDVTAQQLGAVLFNEQRALEGQDIPEANLWKAHAALNRVKRGMGLGHGRGTAPTNIQRIWPNEQPALEASLKAAQQAIDERKRGIDPTGGAYMWRHWNTDPRWSPEMSRDHLGAQTFYGFLPTRMFDPFENQNYTKKQDLNPGDPVYLGVYGK